MLYAFTGLNNNVTVEVLQEMRVIGHNPPIVQPVLSNELFTSIFASLVHRVGILTLQGFVVEGPWIVILVG